ncbi:cytochrome P450 9c1-like [Brevipalpus obovatus]|uniref:cytochrome P450 9c1-like n=1 Tax=Brevipalpus obovatus TaxID=246614 RepID=UPI003D9DD149
MWRRESPASACGDACVGRRFGVPGGLNGGDTLIFRMVRKVLLEAKFLLLLRALFCGDISLAAKRDIEDSLLPFVAGQRWKTLHSALTPCFTTGKMKILFEPMKQCADKAMDEIEKSANDDGKSFQIEFKRLFDRYTLDVAAKCFFAKDLNPYQDGEFVLNANKFAYILFWRMISYIALPNWLIKVLRVYIVPDDLFNYFKNLIVDLAIERKKSGKTGRDFLQLLLDSKLALIDPAQLPEGTKVSKKDLERELTDNEMASSSVLFIIGGYDTSSLQLSWMCYRLALNHHIQERLYQEIMENDTDDYDVLLTMPYLNAVFMETLRMDTPVYCTMRMANRPWRLSDKVEIPKGATVEVPIQVIHMDPDYFPEPEVFDPDRFMPERRAEIPSNAFYGFGSGPRICIGMRFALLDVKIAIVELLKRYELVSTVQNPECGKFSHVRRPIRMDITLKRR